MKELTNWNQMRLIKYSLVLFSAFLLLGFQANGQTVNYVNGGLNVDVTVSNACDGLNNGFLTFNANSASGGTATLLIVDGPIGFTVVGTPISVGVPFVFDNLGAGLPSGTYDFVVDDGGGVAINTFTVTYPAVTLNALNAITVNEDAKSNNTSCITPDGSITVSIAEGSGSYSYSWAGPSGFSSVGVNTTGTPITINGLEGGTYTITVEDDFSVCGTTFDVVLTDPSVSIATDGVVGNTRCAGPFDGAISITASGASGTYTYNWSGPNGFSSTSEDITALEQGNYTINVTDVTSGCVSSKVIAVGDLRPVITIQTDLNTPFSSCTTPNGAISITPLGGSGYSYSWTGPNGYTSAAQDINGLEAGNYSLAVTDIASGCIANTVIVVADTSPTVTATLDSSVGNDNCVTPNGSISISVSGGVGYAYAWTGPAGFTAITEDISGLIGGDYDLIITETSSGCTVPFTATVADNTPVVAIAVDTNTGNSSCVAPNGALSITASGGTSYTYSWSGPSGFSSASEDLTGLEDGNYSLIVTEVASQCTATLNVVVANIKPVVTITTDTQVNNTSCGTPNGSISITAGGGTGYTYAWTGPNGFVSTDEDITALEGGAYNLTVTDITSGCTQSTIINLLDTPPVLGITLDLNTPNTSCVAVNGALSITPTGGTGYTYSWTGPNGFTSTNEDITALEAGAYTVLVTDIASGCTVNANYNLIDNLPVLGITLDNNTGNTNCLTPNGALSITPTGGTGYTYAWTGPAGFTSTNEDISVLIGGGYSVVVTDVASGCTVNANYTVTETLPTLVITLDGTTDNDNCLVPNGTINISVSGGTGYTYAWSGPAGFTSNAEDLTGLDIGTYTVIATDVATDCSSTIDVVVGDSRPTVVIAIDSTTPNSNCVAPFNGSAQITVSGGGPAYTFDWSLGGTPISALEDPTGLEQGTYVLTVTDNVSGCFTTTNVNIGDATSIPVITVDTNTPNTNCTGTFNGEILVSITGGSGAFDYSWTGPAGFTSTVEDISSLEAGDYTLTVTDQNTGCSSSQLVTVNELAAPLVINLDSKTDVSDCITPNGDIQITVTGGTNYLYAWSDGGAFSAATEDISGLSPGNYTLNVTDVDTGCAGTILVTIDDVTVAPVIAIDTQSDNTSCLTPNGVIEITVSGGAAFDYSWVGPGGFTAVSEDLFGLVAGDYTVTVTETTTNCTASQLITINDNVVTPVITIDNVTDNTNCTTPNGAVNVTVTGSVDLTYAWTGAGGFTSSSEDISGLIGDTYTLIVTDNITGCTATVSQVVAELASPIAVTATISDNNSCITPDGSIELTVTGAAGGESYSWNGPGGFTALSKDIFGLLPGDYTVTVSESGCNTISTFTVGDATPVIDITLASKVDQSSCVTPEGEINVDITGVVGYSVSWTNTAGFTSTNEDISGLLADDYTLTVTDPVSGCTATFNITINDNTTVPVITIDSQTDNTDCTTPNGSVNVTVTGSVDVTYLWTSPAGFTASTDDIGGLLGDDYTLLVTDNISGCTATITVPVLELASPIVATLNTAVDNSDCITPNGSLSIDITGAGGAETYSWAGPGGFTANTQNISNLLAGDYTVQITENGCTTVETFTVGDATVPVVITLDILNDNTHCVTPNGSIEISVSGSANPVFAWTSVGGFTASSEDIFGLSADDYTLTVTDGVTGCSSTQLFSIIDSPVVPVLNGVTSDNTSCATANGSITLSVTGTTGGETFDWTGPNGFVANTKDLLGLEAGIYDVIVTDNGCTATVSFEIFDTTVPITISIDATSDNTDCVAPTGSISITAAGGTNLSYSWIGNAGFTSTSEDVTGLVGDIYTVTVTDNDTGCTATEIVTIAELASPIGVTALVVDNTACLTSNGSVEITVTGVTGGESFQWNGPGGFTAISKDIFGLAAGDYTVSVSEAGCVTNTTFTVADNPVAIIVVEDSKTPNTVCVAPFDGTAQITASGGDGNFTYSWTGPNGFTSTDEDLAAVEAGLYTVTVTDGNGCTETLDVTVDDATPSPVITVDNIGANSSCTAPYDGLIEVSVSGGSGDYSYAWVGALGFTSTSEDISGVFGGNYTLVVTDNISGCTVNALVTVDNPAACAVNCAGFSFSFDDTLPTCGSDNGILVIDNPSLDGVPLTNYQITLYRAGDMVPRVEPNPTNNTIIDLQAGDYTYEVLDFLTGRVCVGTIPLPFATSVQATATSFIDSPCFGENLGSAVINASGSSTGQYFFSVDNGINWTAFTPGNKIDNLPPNGTYNIFVAESTNDNCPALVSVTINALSNEIFIDYSVTESSCTINTGVIDITSVTGGTGVFTSYKLDGSNVDISSPLTDIGGGLHQFEAVADNGCSAVFDILVPFPGLVNFDSFVTDPDCTTGGANNGSIEVDIVDIGNFEVGLSLSQAVAPAFYFPTSDKFSFDNLNKGDYYVYVRKLGSDCPTIERISITGGPTNITFDASSECVVNSTDQRIVISNIMAEQNQPLTIEVFAFGANTASTTINLPKIPAGNGYIIEGDNFLSVQGEYLIQISQLQGTCGGASIVSELNSVVIHETLRATVLDKVVSYPDKPNGTMQIGDFVGGQSPYYAEIELTTPAFGGQTFVQGPETVGLNSNLDYEINYEGMPAGRYDILIFDEIGCTFKISETIEVNTELFIPNIFTPNNDGENDVFYIRNLPPTGAQLTITNRWGTQVFSSKSYENDWDASDASDGVYFYVLKVDKDITRGWVEIQRGVKPGN